MSKKLVVIVLIIILMFTNCNIINFDEDYLSTQREYIEEIQTNSSSLTSTKNKQITSLSTSVPTRINIKIPKDISFKPFENEDYVSLEDFEFDKYFPMIKLMVPESTNHPLIYDYAILSDTCSNLEDGDLLYKVISSNFSTSSNKEQTNYYSNVIYNYLGKRRILKISVDGEKVLCATINDVSKPSSDEVIFHKGRIFDVIVEIFHGEELTYSESIVKGKGIYESLSNLGLYENQFSFGLQQTNLSSFYDCEAGMYIAQVISKNELLVVVSQNYSVGENETVFHRNSDEVNNSDVYIINTDTSEEKYIGSYMFDPVISPDLKYIIYNYPNGEGAHQYFNKINKLEDMPKGFFIKNLETNETTFISVGEEYEVYSSVGWIKRDGLESLMK